MQTFLSFLKKGYKTPEVLAPLFNRVPDGMWREVCKAIKPSLDWRSMTERKRLETALEKLGFPNADGAVAPGPTASVRPKSAGGLAR